MVGAGTMSVLVILVLAQTSYMMKLTKEIKKKESEAEKKIEEMQKNWNKLEGAINRLTQEVGRGGLRTKVTTIAPARYLPALGKEHMESLYQGHSNLSSIRSAQNIFPYRGSNTLSIE